MVGETNGPNEHEVRMATSEHKLDDLLAFVHMIVKETRREKMAKVTNGEVSEGRPHINMDLLPRPPTPPKPEGRDSQLDELDRSDPQRNGEEEQRDFQRIHPVVEKKWRPRACPLLDEKEMIKIFVNTLKNPYFDQVIGLQLQFLVDFILVEERIEDAVKTKRMVDMPALMALVEQIAKRTLIEKNKGEVQMIAKNDEKWRRTIMKGREELDEEAQMEGDGAQRDEEAMHDDEEPPSVPPMAPSSSHANEDNFQLMFRAYGLHGN
uniref:Uncharacterized protein n=1 Tax=Fagus sylvatica TaxID=28930 RepID=A0A2N9GPT8_FAGSY